MDNSLIIPIKDITCNECAEAKVPKLVDNALYSRTMFKSHGRMNQLTVEVEINKLSRVLLPSGLYSVSAELRVFCPKCQRNALQTKPLLAQQLDLVRELATCLACGAKGTLHNSKMEVRHIDDYTDEIFSETTFFCEKCLRKRSFASRLAVDLRRLVSIFNRSKGRVPPQMLNQALSLSGKSESLNALGVSVSDTQECTPSTVFLSYSHSDSRWRDRLEVHLKPLIRQGFIDLWDDRRIHAGEEWRQEIDIALHSAKVAILLISADFLASEFIVNNELPSLLAAERDRGLKILPLIVGPSRYRESPLGVFQAVNALEKPLSRLQKAEAETFLVALSKEVERQLC